MRREAAQSTHGAQQTDLENDVREGNVNSDSEDSSDDVQTRVGCQLRMNHHNLHASGVDQERHQHLQKQSRRMYKKEDLNQQE